LRQSTSASGGSACWWLQEQQQVRRLTLRLAGTTAKTATALQRCKICNGLMLFLENGIAGSAQQQE
jgi:hypothetical protein